MKTLKRVCEEQQLKIDNLTSENAMLKAQIQFMEQAQKTDEAYTELMKDFEMTEDFRCQVEEENFELKKRIEYLEHENKWLQELVSDCCDAVEETDELESEIYNLKCELAEAKTSSNAYIIRQIVNALKGAGVIAQNTEVRL